jgi:alkylhydroperoxidase/carboxymuconolactone decarboxylase family protein YurZ
MAEKQTAGRDRLGKIAPEFAHLNDDVLFGEVWAREKELSPRGPLYDHDCGAVLGGAVPAA